ncbi:MAG: anaerobic ribonucleoside-triphosphate reductase activating protein [Bdellovibrionota bacterium]|jgi:pyruvate formate lyase activating enzyme
MIEEALPSPVFGYLPQPSMLDFRGHLSIVFFLSGCNFRCRFCHNKTLLPNADQNITWKDLDTFCQTFKDNWIDGVVITGGEPTLSPDLKALITFFKDRDLKIKLDTNGSNPQIMEELLPLVDYIAVDVKCPLEDYPYLTGFKDTESLKRTIKILKNGSVPYEFRTTIIEGYHTKDKLIAIKDLVQDAMCYVLQPFVPRETVLDEEFKNIPRTSDKFLKECAKIFEGSVKELIVA